MLAAWFRTKAGKAIIKGGVFCSAITFAVFIPASCNHLPGIVAGQYPSPSGKTWQVELVGMSAKVERAAIAVVIKLTAGVTVFFNWLEFVFHLG